MAFDSEKTIILNKNENAGISDLVGRPIISGVDVDQLAIRNICPFRAIAVNPVRIDLGKCTFCKECSEAFPGKISFTPDSSLASNVRDRLVVIERDYEPILPDGDLVRDAVRNFKSPVIKLRLVADETTQGMVSRNQFKEHQVELIDDASEAHGLLLASAGFDLELLRSLYASLQHPRMIIIAGAAAITEYDSLTNSGVWPERWKADLFVAGESIHPRTLAKGIIELTKSIQ
jgi:hypothetical protein